MNNTILTDRAAKKLGVRATAYVEEHVAMTLSSKQRLVPERTDTPGGVHRTLCRLYGRPLTFDRGEVAYWLLDASDVTDCDD